MFNTHFATLNGGGLSRVLLATAVALLTAGPALASPTNAIAVVQIDGQAPSAHAPFSKGSSGQGTNSAAVGADVSEGDVLGNLHRQAEGSGSASVEGGRISLFGKLQLTDFGRGSTGRISVDSLGLATDVITIQGTPAQAGLHLKLNGEFDIFANLMTDAHGQASAEFPRPPASPFADADTRVLFDMASNGIAGGVATLAESHHGINNETGRTFAVDTERSTVPFSLDIVVGQPTEITFVAEISAIATLADLTGTPFNGGDGDVASNLAFYGGVVTWMQDAASLSRADTGRTVHGFSLTSESGFDWLGDGAGPAGAPEPAGWALMIAGFGLAGSAQRRRAAAA